MKTRSIITVLLVLGLVASFYPATATNAAGGNDTHPRSAALTSDATLHISNISEGSVTISWRTASAVTGQVRYGLSTPATVVEDQRGSGFTSQIHSVVISTGLAANTTYQFDLVSGGVVDDNGGAHYTFTTSVALPPSAPDGAFGRVYLPNGSTPASGAMVYLRLKNSSGESTQLSTLTGMSGGWSVNLSSALKQDRSGYFSYAAGDQLLIDVLAGNGCSASAGITVGNHAPAPNVILSCTTSTYTLTYTAGAHGTISGASPQTVNSGASGTAVTAVSDNGYHFVNWSDASTINPRTDTPVIANISVTANFAINTERILNGGFETYKTSNPKLPKNWTAVKFGVLDGKDTTNHQAGRASLKIMGAGTTTKNLTQKVKFSDGVAGNAFAFSFYVKGSTLPKIGTCQVSVILYNAANIKVGTKIVKCPSTTTTFNWKKVSGNFSSTAPYTYAVITITVKKASGTVWFDGVSLLR